MSQNPPTTISEMKHPYGINEDAAESSVPEGFVESLVNGYPSGDLLVKRSGYELKGGAIPLRVISVRSNVATNVLYLSVSGNVDISSVGNRPIIVYGTISHDYTDAFDTVTPSGIFIRSPSLDPRKLVSAGTSSTLTLSEIETGLTSGNILVGVAESLSFTDGSNTIVYPDITVGQIAPFDISASIANGTSSDKYFFLYYIKADDTEYPSFIHTQSIAGTVWTFTPSLPSNNLLINYYDASGANCLPESQVINYVTGVVTATFGRSITGKAVCVTVPAVNALQGNQILSYTQVVDGDSTITLPAGTADKYWGFIDVFTVDVGANTYTKVLPNSITVNTDGSVSINFINQSIDIPTTRILWTFTGVQATVALQLTTETVTEDYTDSVPSLCVYGLSSEEIFEGAEGNTGWVTAVDSYNTEDSLDIFATSGWNSFVAKDDSDLLLPSHQIFLRCNTYSGGTDTVISPLFLPSAPIYARTRGQIVSTSVSSSNTVEATEFSYSAGTGFVTFHITLTSPTVSGTPLLVANQDFVKITQAPYSFLIGEWEIQGFTVGADYIDISVVIPEIDDTGYDTSSTSVELGVFTDSIPFPEPCPFIPGDVITSEVLNIEGVTVLSVEDTETAPVSITVNNITSNVNMGQKLLVLAVREDTSVVGMSTALDAYIDEDDLNIIQEDVCQILTEDFTKRRRIASVFAYAATEVSVTNDTVSITGMQFSTAELQVGQKLLFVAAGKYTGVREVVSFTGQYAFKIDYSDGLNTPKVVTIQGPTVELDSPITISDTVATPATISIPERWKAIEIPTATIGGTVTNINSPNPYQFSSTWEDQPLVRTTMVNDTLFMTNGIDPIMKYDGTSWSMAGIPRFCPKITTGITTGYLAGSLLSVLPVAAPIYVSSGSKIYLADGEQLAFAEGDTVRFSVNTTWKNVDLTIQAVTTETILGTPYGVLVVDVTLGSIAYDANERIVTSGLVYKYYFRLQYVDRNNNIISSAVTGSQDSFVKLTSVSTVNFGLLPMPLYNPYDAGRFEIEVYRTKANEATQYYRIRNVQLSYAETGTDNLGTHIIDKTDDIFLSLQDADPVAVATSGAELPTGSYPPPIGKYITSIDNRLVVAATTSVPKIGIRFMDGDGANIALTDLYGAYVTIVKDSEQTLSSTMVNGTNLIFQFVSDSATTPPYMFSFTATTDLAFSTSGNVATVIITKTGVGTGLVAGNWIFLSRTPGVGSSGCNCRFAGWHKLTAAASGAIEFKTIITDTSSISAIDGDRIYKSSSPSGAVPVPLTDQGCFQTVGNTEATARPLQIVVQRLVAAINSVAALDKDSNWILANGGGDYPIGQLTLEVPTPLSTIPEFRLFDYDTTGFNLKNKLKVFGNGVYRLPSISSGVGDTVGAVSRYRGSRVCVSYRNFPEMFDNPNVDTATESSGVFDVNPADGQDITGIIPLMGSSTSQSSQLEGILIVAKERSFYAVNINNRTVQKLETNGIGCTAPYSIGYMEGGIAFASDSGFYLLTRSLEVLPIGDNIGRSFGTIDKDSFSRLHGHHFGELQQYKMSDDQERVFVASYSGIRKTGSPAWSLFNNHPVTGGWCNYGKQEAFASTCNRVFINRNSGTVEDYRDGEAGISFSCVFRLMDFGEPTIRKQIRHCTVAFRNMEEASTGLQVYAATNASTSFTALDENNLSTSSVKKIQNIRYSLPNGRFNYLQLKVTDATIDQPVEIAGVSYRVVGLTTFGVTEAKETVT